MPIFVGEGCVPSWARRCFFITPARAALRKSSGERDEFLKPGAGGALGSTDPAPCSCALPPSRAVTRRWPVLRFPSTPPFFFLLYFHYYLYFRTQLNWEVEGRESGTRQTDIMGLNPAQLFSQQPSPLQSQGNKCSSGGSWWLMMI